MKNIITLGWSKEFGKNSESPIECNINTGTKCNSHQDYFKFESESLRKYGPVFNPDKVPYLY